MKFTNKDGLLRIYDGTYDTTQYEVSQVVDTHEVELVITGTPGFTPGAFRGRKLKMVDGDMAGHSFYITDNSANIIAIQRHPGSIRIAAGDLLVLDDPFYFEFCLDNGDFTAPVGVPTQENSLVLSRGRANDCMHYVLGSEAAILEPVEVSFTVMVNDSEKFIDLLRWIEGKDVNGQTIVSTKGTSDRTAYTTGINFADTTKKTCDLMYQLSGDGKWYTIAYDEVYFDLGSLSITEAEDGVNLSMTGMCYGNITSTISMRPGTDIVTV